MKTIWAACSFDGGVEDFIIRGIYTLESDARAHESRLNECGDKAPCACEMSFEQLTDMLIEQRLRPFTKVGTFAIDHGISSGPSTRILFNYNGMPAAVTE